MMLLELNSVHTYYGEAHILQDVTLRVAAGEVVTLIGRNGAGKTTTLRSVMGMAPPRAGRITFGGGELAGLPPHEIARRGIAYIPEERRILPNLTVHENLRLGMLGSGPGGHPGRVPAPKAWVPGSAGGAGARAEDGALVEEVLTYFPPLRERLTQKGKSLSGGEQQMLAIARGLVARPKLMLVDEPTEGLAPLLVGTLTEILREINRRGTTILLVEQTLEVALTLSHRLYVMDQGRIRFEGTPETLRKDPAIQQRFLGI